MTTRSHSRNRGLHMSLLALTASASIVVGMFATAVPAYSDDTGLRVKMCVWLGVSRGLDLAFLNAD